MTRRTDELEREAKKLAEAVSEGTVADNGAIEVLASLVQELAANLKETEKLLWELATEVEALKERR